jgi:hypothetical protein
MTLSSFRDGGTAGKKQALCSSCGGEMALKGSGPIVDAHPGSEPRRAAPRRRTDRPPARASSDGDAKVRTWVTATQIEARGSPRWVPDAEAALCMLCESTAFGTFQRRHHCRSCGWVVCAACLPQGQVRELATWVTADGAMDSMDAPTGDRVLHKVCNGCVQALAENAPEGSLSARPARSPPALQGSDLSPPESAGHPIGGAAEPKPRRPARRAAAGREPVKTGYLTKKGGISSGWLLRYFVLDQEGQL